MGALGSDDALIDGSHELHCRDELTLLLLPSFSGALGLGLTGGGLFLRHCD